MKIISKYKDFYDFIVQDYDADLIYVRNIGLVNEYFDDLFRKEGNSIPCYSKYYGYQDSYRSRRDNGELTFDNFIFGIYPFVYSQPFLRIYYHSKDSGNLYSCIIILNKEIVDGLLNSDNNIAKHTLENKLIPMAQKYLDNMFAENICDYTCVKFTGELPTIKKLLAHYTWKVECPEIFYKIQSPVFVKYHVELFNNSPYKENWPKEPKIGTSKYIHYVTDISFQKLNFNIIKYWYNDVCDLNTYNNIENFLWSIKQEPESNPDNNTKIVAHGFDLKTSFRKM